MSSEPIERRVSYLGDRLKASRCQCCGKEYFEIRDYCSNCGRKSYGKMESIDLFYDKGKLELATYINEPTNKFSKLGSFVYGIVSFHGGKIRVPARLTDQLLCDGKNIDLASLEGREVIPRFRRRYSVGKSDLIPTISLAFTLADEYYPHQEYKIITPTKDYELPGIVGYGMYSSKFRFKEESWEHAAPFIDEDSVTAAVEAGKLALIHSGLDSSLIGKVYAGSESPLRSKTDRSQSRPGPKTRQRRRRRTRRRRSRHGIRLQSRIEHVQRRLRTRQLPTLRHQLRNGYWRRQFPSGSTWLPRRRTCPIRRLRRRSIHTWQTRRHRRS
jgi:uncharacterized OB-fold protein